MRVRLPLSLLHTKIWNITNYNKSIKINFHWFKFYTLLYQIILQNNNTQTNSYQLYLTKLKVFNKLNSVIIDYKNVNYIPTQPSFNNNQKQYSFFWQENRLHNNHTYKLLFTPSHTKPNLFYLYLDFANISDASYTKIHKQNRGFFIDNNYTPFTPYINISNIHKKWVHFYNFLINLFFAKTEVFMYSSKLLKNETLSFNWSYDLFTYSHFKKVSPYFFLKNAQYGHTSSIVYTNLIKSKIEVAFISDIKYHDKSMFQLRTNNIYLLGLVPYSANPWLLHYSMPTASNTLFTQYFFIKFLMHIRQQAEYRKFSNLKHLWYLK